MRIGVIGSGYVGLVTGTCLADSGNHVVAVDSDVDKVRLLSDGHCPFFEPGLEEMMRENMHAGRLSFSTELAPVVADARVVFIAVGTPPRVDGSADLAAVEAVAASIARAMRGPLIIVVKSTVPVGTGAALEKLIARHTRHPFSVASNPEFLKEGNAVDDFLRPDRVVIGTDDPRAAEALAELHRPFVRNNKPIIHMSRAAAELTKYAANAYLAMRISFINEIGELCEHFDIDVDEVRRGIGADARIGYHFLYPGVGYGGSCFPKDVQALAETARSVGVRAGITESVHQRNVRQRTRMVERIVARLGAELRGRRIAVWGLSFKPKTDDIREAPAIFIIESMLAAGAEVAIYDPRAMDNARRILAGRVRYGRDAYDVLEQADALVISTEWNEFRSPDFERMRSAMRQPIIFDGRNLYEPAAMARYGYEYHSVGRPDVRRKNAT
jgi:UDPglucose 6-dehydrogenase